MQALESCLEELVAIEKTFHNMISAVIVLYGKMAKVNQSLQHSYVIQDKKNYRVIIDWGKSSLQVSTTDNFSGDIEGLPYYNIYATSNL